MAGEQLYFESCADIDEFFREGREYFNELYVKKLVVNSAYYQRVREMPWPLNAETTQKAFRFGRGFHDPCKPWRKINAGRCEVDSCDTKPEIVTRPGTNSYNFELFRREMETQWICVEDLMYRLFPAEEVLQIEESNIRVTRNVHEEFVRSNYIAGAQYKWLGIANDDGVYCGDIEDSGFYVEEWDGDNEGSYNMCRIRVKIDPANFANIAYLSMSLLQQALIRLKYQDDAFRPDLTDASGRQLLEVILPDEITGQYIWEQQKQAGGWWNANTDFDNELRKMKIGIDRVIGDFAFGYDINAPRFNVDSVFNATLGAYSEADPDTWPALIRVPLYIQTSAEIGCEYIVNPAYFSADFGISVAWVDKAFVKWRQPSVSGYSNAQMAPQNYAGDWDWRRPDWECNRRLTSGFFQAQFRIAAQITDPTLINVFLHRIPGPKALIKACCPINENYVAPVTPDCYVCEGAGG